MVWIMLPAIALSAQPVNTWQPSAQLVAQQPPNLPDFTDPPAELPPQPQPLPAPEDLLPLPPRPELPESGLDVPGTVVVEQFQVTGSTVFSQSELSNATAAYTNRPITFAELFEARSAITQLYVEAGYITSGAFIPSDQTISDGVVEIRVVEGKLEEIVVEGLENLNPNYVRSRIAVAAGKPLDVDQLIEGLQLLQIDPLIESLSADLAAGTQTGGSLLTVSVVEADSTRGELTVDNGRSPTVGTLRRRAQISEGNLVGLGDRLVLGYSQTDGSDAWDLSYTVPFNPYNGTIGLLYSTSDSRVIEDDFEILDIESDSEAIELTLRQPVLQTPNQEFALGLTLSHDVSRSTFQLPGTDRLGFPTPGADAGGEIQITALRFSQEWTQRQVDQVIALRSQFNLGIDWFEATINDNDQPDSRFFSWQGQAQWVKLLSRDTLLLARLNTQLADRPLLSLEQFRIGGQGSVRGYRQDRTTADSGLFASLEVRLPILRIPEWESLVQLTPFVDYGLAWNRGDRPAPDADELASVGIGLLWQAGDRVTARLDWGIPLIEDNADGDSLQENGILFTLTGTLF
ncbi:ShlB/FhaC/HecB family hemolysin secretion/activation protein [Sphaerothrix gracilis]|uniref:ShlB/FhaC/HecB family hemolysin secretion/activation protein n=1 Tax=Sphaerothrix gracilis TaxID=3151835 RepID=UPI0031FD496C